MESESSRVQKSRRAVVGELDEDLDAQIDMSALRAAPLQPVAH